MRLFKMIAVDVAGISLIILSALTGWIPGPGGIPLFLAGLGLLAIHHHWARRFMEHLRTHSLKLANTFFREHRVLMFVYDIVALLLIIAGFLTLFKIHGFMKAVAPVLILLGLSLFLGNRKRLQRINAYFRKQT